MGFLFLLQIVLFFFFLIDFKVDRADDRHILRAYRLRQTSRGGKKKSSININTVYQFHRCVFHKFEIAPQTNTI